MADVVRPVLTERAQAMHGDTLGAGESFARAYQVAVDVGLAPKGQTYRHYLDHQG